MERTIEQLSNLNGKVYVYLSDREAEKMFLLEAEKEGFSFGKIKPTQTNGANLIAVEKDKKLSYANFVGRLAFQCPSAVKGEFYRVDYKKYAAGESDYLMD